MCGNCGGGGCVCFRGGFVGVCKLGHVDIGQTPDDIVHITDHTYVVEIKAERTIWT